MSEARKAESRSAAEIAAQIARRREALAATLDEIAVRVHPKTIVSDARNRVAASVDRTAGKAYVAANRTVSGVREKMTDAEGGPRMDRLVPVALVAAVAVGLLVASTRRRHR